AGELARAPGRKEIHVVQELRREQENEDGEGQVVAREDFPVRSRGEDEGRDRNTRAQQAVEQGNERRRRAGDGRLHPVQLQVNRLRVPQRAFDCQAFRKQVFCPGASHLLPRDFFFFLLLAVLLRRSFAGASTTRSNSVFYFTRSKRNAT